MKNPWSDFEPTGGEMVHPEDEPFVRAYNEVVKNPDHQLRLGMWPHPWVGPLATAQVVVLAANPGGSDEAQQREARLGEQQRANLSGTHPLFFLDPAAHYASDWFRSRLLKDVLKELGGGSEADERVASRLAIADLHPYHSTKWRAMPVTLPTQEYTFSLVRKRLQEGAAVVITRAALEWKISVPELLRSDLVFQTRSTQQPRLSRANLGERGWDTLMQRLGG